MAEKLTNEQQAAVDSRERSLLVSAAAGSGKTKVLVERLFSYVEREDGRSRFADVLTVSSGRKWILIRTESFSIRMYWLSPLVWKNITDMGLFQNKIRVGFEYYLKKGKDMITSLLVCS